MIAPADDWIAIAKLPIARKSARALVHSKAVEAKEVRGRLYVSRASFDAYMRSKDAPITAPTEDDALRVELGLTTRAAAR